MLEALFPQSYKPIISMNIMPTIIDPHTEVNYKSKSSS
uniref:Uncharacterized protein n=1 Tax=Anguilla anguilla TaxID=7936 RepID=A0A0E9SY04_ANGAN